MKSINTYINEARKSRMDEPSTIYFPSMSSFLIYKYEIEGQISDGYWENSTPYSHWKWISKATCIVDENASIGYFGPRHSKNYNCSWITDELGKALNGVNNDYNWLVRAMNYGHAGRVLDKSKIDRLSDKYAYRAIIGSLPEEPIEFEDFEEYISNEKDWYLKYWEEAKDVLNKSFFKKYYKTKYTFRDFKFDVTEAQEAINTQLGESPEEM